MAAVEVQNVRKVYRRDTQEIVVLDGIDLQVPEGEFVALMGPSGSGKTTLLLMCGGLLRPTSGRVWISGTDITSLTESRLPQLRLTRVGFVFQLANLLASLTAVENVRIVLEAAAWPRPRAHQRAVRLLRRIGLGDRLDHLPAQLSGGERQRVAIARALANRPPLILADEPTGALDSKNGAAVMALLRELADDGDTSVVCVTHDARIAALADRVLWLEDGVLSDASPEQRSAE